MKKTIGIENEPGTGYNEANRKENGWIGSKNNDRMNEKTNFLWNKINCRDFREINKSRWIYDNFFKSGTEGKTAHNNVDTF